MAEMEKRLMRFVIYIREHPRCSSAQLASALSVTTRTLHNYKTRANTLLEGSAHVQVHREGWRLHIDDEPLFAVRLASSLSQQRATAVKRMPDTRSGRVSYLLSDLISRVGWITLDELASILFITRRTVSSDLKEVEALLARFDLKLERRPRYGIRVVGPEMARRLCLATVAIDEFGTESANSIREELIEAVACSVNQTLRRSDLEITSIAYQGLLIHVCIAIIRIQDGCYVPMEPDQLSTIVGSQEYRTARVLAEDIEHRLGIILPCEEIAYIAIHLAGKQTLCAPNDDAGRGIVISDEIWDIVSAMLDRLWRAFRFDFRQDIELRMNLACHIVPLSVRLTYRLKLHNPMVVDIKMRYPLAWFMAIDASSVLAENYDADPSEDEIGYLALTFALAVERTKTRAANKSILVVCASGEGSARFLKYRYQQEFGSYVSRIVTCDVSHVASFDLSDIDYVFTTVPLPVHLPVPVREVKYFFDANDVEDVRGVLQGRQKVEKGAAGLFDSTLFFAHMPSTDKASAIAFLCSRAHRAADLPDNFEKLIWERERAATTAFGNGVALPHPSRAVSDRSFLVAGIADHGIDWNGQLVRVVFLIVVARSAHDELEECFMNLARLVTSKQAIRELLDNPTYERLLELMQISNERNRS